MFGITPAHAGKRPRAQGRDAQARDHPRSRGEKKNSAVPSSVQKGSPPLTRGKGKGRYHRLARAGITPAHAGKSVSNARSMCKPQDHPRSRGEKLLLAGLPVGREGSPPLTRGKVNHFSTLVFSLGITPAHAGKSKKSAASSGAFGDHPRSRGEKGRVRAGRERRIGSPPLTRGKELKRSLMDEVRGITPAHAGKSKTASCRRAMMWDHPRSRGEKHFVTSSSLFAMGSPPLTRGKAARTLPPLCLPRITPAHAGKSFSRFFEKIFSWDHPRSRGEKRHLSGGCAPVLGSPPLTRGKACRAPPPVCRGGITPAHAGKSLTLEQCMKVYGDHPRSRGEKLALPLRRHHAEDHPRSRGEKLSDEVVQVGERGSPPLTRGKVYNLLIVRALRRITPAHAGKSCFSPWHSRRSWDHPRSRGEKLAFASQLDAGPGSPPLTRGKEP